VFLSVDDLDAVHHGGRDAFARLARAFDTARALADSGRLDFVAAPVPTRSGSSVVRMTPRYTLALFPHIEGRAGSFGTPLTGADRQRLLAALAHLHLATGVVTDTAPEFSMDIPDRAELEAALDALDRPWTGGPFIEPMRKLLTVHEDNLRSEFAQHDRLARDLAGAAAHRVVTHGEPHGGNVMLSPDRLWLIDWDTVALAPPERDLWMLAAESESGDPHGDGDFEAYTEITGRPVDPAVVAWFRLRWRLADISAFVAEFRRPHARTSDTELGWTFLQGYLPAT
jgi:hypothetical protein